eukprot:2133661-Rhodomonas_salina.1
MHRGGHARYESGLKVHTLAQTALQQKENRGGDCEKECAVSQPGGTAQCVSPGRPVTRMYKDSGVDLDRIDRLCGCTIIIVRIAITNTTVDMKGGRPALSFSQVPLH